MYFGSVFVFLEFYPIGFHEILETDWTTDHVLCVHILFIYESSWVYSVIDIPVTFTLNHGSFQQYLIEHLISRIFCFYRRFDFSLMFQCCFYFSKVIDFIWYLITFLLCIYHDCYWHTFFSYVYCITLQHITAIFYLYKGRVQRTYNFRIMT